MKNKKLLTPFFVILGIFFMSNCSSTPKFSARDSDNQKKYTIKKGELFRIELEAQLSTGYGWQVASISGAEQSGQIKVETAQSEMTGGKDMQFISFKATTVGNGFIELKYVQPWKANDTPLKYYKIYLTIE